ncbi:hypothetical protein EVAR_102432_1 [Eumeta japonica]|uniref:Uncharacterized protein n=1 Tax=Eumeta variegata TaxID=151549 RepID=A0A4C1YZX2_EUMVA|nr:hypothetical protein EVAR_102432_1 [Eumeta japonica]
MDRARYGQHICAQASYFNFSFTSIRTPGDRSGSCLRGQYVSAIDMGVLICIVSAAARRTDGRGPLFIFIGLVRSGDTASLPNPAMTYVHKVHKTVGACVAAYVCRYYHICRGKGWSGDGRAAPAPFAAVARARPLPYCLKRCLCKSIVVKAIPVVRLPSPISAMCTTMKTSGSRLDKH